MKKLLIGVAALPFLGTAAFAAQPLTDKQMDTVTAGFTLILLEATNFASDAVLVNFPPLSCLSSCYLTAKAGFVQVFADTGNGISIGP